MPATSIVKNENPYKSPHASASGKSEAASVDVLSAVSVFQVGKEEKHEVCVTWSLWSGEEIYVIDGQEIARMRSFEFSGVRKFDVGEAGKHKVEIRFRTLPFNVVEVFVDGRCHIRNLFPGLSLLQWVIAAVIFVPSGLVLAWLLYVKV